MTLAPHNLAPCNDRALESIDNVRDLGGIPTAEGRMVAPGLFYRGGALYNATLKDRETLFDTLGISLVIDLRCGWEREAKPDPDIPGVENLHIPFYDLEKVGIEYTEPAEGTKVVGRDVACDPDRFYRSMANPLTANQMRKALERAFASAEQGRPVYLHCSGGKDRAGILAVLVLRVLGASPESILEDYLRTNVSRDRNYRKAFERFLRFADGDEAHAHELTLAHRARPENLAAFREAVEERYGSIDSFVGDTLGFDASRCARARALCTRPAPEPECAARSSAPCSQPEAFRSNAFHELV